VLPSRGLYETWGLAVNEAMHMGVPALVSERVGCQRDLVTDGETGWVFRHDSKEDFHLKLSEAAGAIRQKATRDKVRQRVHERIRNYSYHAATSGLCLAISRLGNRRINSV
jgi:glycosyltransferase involved in cell wall biosynthesis